MALAAAPARLRPARRGQAEGCLTWSSSTRPRPPPGPEPRADLLRRLQAEDAERRLFAIFEAISGAEDASYELRELHRRVGAGTLAWEELWLAPEQEPGGHELVNAAMRAEGAAVADTLAAFAAEEPGADPGAGPGGVLGR